MATPKAIAIELSETEAVELASRLRRRRVARADAMRAEIVLLAAERVSNLAIAKRLGITRVTVTTWRRRFAEKRLDGLLNEPRPVAPRTITDQKVADVVTTTLETLPVGRTHWSSRGMARSSGLGPIDGATDLESVLAATTPQRDLQAVDRPAVRRQGT